MISNHYLVCDYCTCGTCSFYNGLISFSGIKPFLNHSFQKIASIQLDAILLAKNISNCCNEYGIALILEVNELTNNELILLVNYRKFVRDPIVHNVWLYSNDNLETYTLLKK